MKKGLLILSGLAVIITAALFSFNTSSPVYEYQIITTVESIIPMGLGRSRIIMEQEDVDPSMFATQRTDGKTSGQGKVSRDDLKLEKFEETKLLNFYSAVGINFQNIASNDAIIGAKLTQLNAEGWELAFVSSGVESDAGKEDGRGIFVTRYAFKRLKN
jgi:hypothetical protein